MRFFVSVFVALASLVAVAGEIPRKEYPRPQFERDQWQNLNGQWDYTFDFAGSGLEQGYPAATTFEGKITVPFCPESKLSGVEHKDFINNIWYHREIEIPQEWEGKNILLNFGAVYYNAEIFIDGTLAGRHFGGSSSFSQDITPYVKPGANTISWCTHRAISAQANRARANRTSSMPHMAATILAPPASGRQCGWKRSLRGEWNRHRCLPT